MINNARDEYFNRLYDKACGNRYRDRIYSKLLAHLHDIDFRYSMLRDSNRAEDGVSLRYRFGFDKDIDGPCSVLEMLLGLAIRCEETIMDDPSKGDRTTQWFWTMINNLGLSDQRDDIYNKRYVDRVIEEFLNRDYSPDGRGGLFYIPSCKYDLRDVEIWNQLCWYLDEYGLIY